MQREDLILSAQKLKQITEKSVREFSSQRNHLVDVMNKKMELSAECYNEVYPYYNWMQINILTFNKLAEDNLETLYSAH